MFIELHCRFTTLAWPEPMSRIYLPWLRNVNMYTNAYEWKNGETTRLIIDDDERGWINSCSGLVPDQMKSFKLSLFIFSLPRQGIEPSLDPGEDKVKPFIHCVCITLYLAENTDNSNLLYRNGVVTLENETVFFTSFVLVYTKEGLHFFGAIYSNYPIKYSGNRNKGLENRYYLDKLGSRKPNVQWVPINMGIRWRFLTCLPPPS